MQIEDDKLLIELNNRIVELILENQSLRIITNSHNAETLRWKRCYEILRYNLYTMSLWHRILFVFIPHKLLFSNIYKLKDEKN